MDQWRNMFIRLFLAALLSTCALVQNAISQNKGNLYLEPVIGFHTRWIANQDIYGNAEMDYATTYGASAGFRMYYFPDDDIGLSAGFGYRKMGQNYEGDQRGANAVRKVSLNYIQIPVMAMFALSGHQYPTWFSIGPQAFFLTGSQQYFFRNEGGSPLNNPDYLPAGTINVYDWYRPVDILVGIEFNKMFRLDKLPKLTANITFEGAYGIFDINSKEYRIPNVRGIYEGSHNMYIGFRFGLLYNTTK
ncbi:MAG TPA: outer membrane beta-barrel protein [Bacteroidales bacterium]|nr:outer membrane beta-barrel protein [Bacteroidales bacterium]